MGSIFISLLTKTEIMKAVSSLSPIRSNTGLVFILFLFLALQQIDCSSQAFTQDATFHAEYNFNDGLIEEVVLLPNETMMINGVFRQQEQTGQIIARAFFSTSGTFLYYPDYHWSISGTQIQLYQENIYYHTLAYIYKLDLYGNMDTSIWYLQNNENLSLSIVGGFFFVENEKLLVAGSSIGTGIFDPNQDGYSFLSRVNTDFTFDSTWLHDTDYWIKRLYRYNDTSFITDGRFQYYYSDSSIAVETNSGIIKFDHNGNVDTNFVSEDLDKWSEIRQLKALKDGRIMVYGRFNFMETSPYYDQDDYYLLRLLPNGQIDTNFSFLKSLVYNPGNYYAYISAIEELDNGSYLIGGLFDSIQGHARGCIAIIDSTGMLDLNHFTSTGADSAYIIYSADYRGIYGITSTDDDKYYLYGRFSRFDGEVCAPIIRIFGESYISVPEVPQVQSLIKIYPNPANDYMQIEIPGNQNYGILEIYSIQGQILQSVSIKQNHQTINISSLLPGIYLCKLFISNEIYQAELVVVR